LDERHRGDIPSVPFLLLFVVDVVDYERILNLTSSPA